MEFDFSPYQQKPNNWYLTSVKYSGDGVAEFQNPKGKIWGKTKVTFDEHGENLIEMEVDGRKTEDELPLGLEQLLSADKPIKKDGQLLLTWPPSKLNLCLKLEVKTNIGNFVANNIEHFDHRFEYHKEFGTKDWVRFYPSRSRFDSINTETAKYWVMPLINFCSDYMQYDPDLSNHPLRIYPDVFVPTDIPNEHISTAQFIATQRSRLIIFDYEKKKAFIEAITGHDDREIRLKRHQDNSLITALMVGEIGSHCIDLDKVNEWFPFYFLNILGLITGSEVGTPWIEYRDASGDLVRRIHGHLGFGRSFYTQGRQSIHEVFHRRTGKILNLAQKCQAMNQSYFRASLRHIILGGRFSQSIEDQMDHLCRALDALNEHFGVRDQYLFTGICQDDRDIINTSIKNVNSVILKISKDLEIKGDLVRSRYLHIIMDRLSNVANKERNFGLSVCDLMKIFNLPDADVMDLYYFSHPRKDNCKKWSDVISKYRGMVIHSGYFDLKTNEYDFEDIWSVINHLHDILLRIIYLILGYDGEYNPTVGNSMGDKPIYWVQLDTPVGDLGYK